MSRSLAILLVASTVAHAEPLSLHDAPRPSPRHHVRMGLELAAIFAVGHEWYWRDNGAPNAVDWQLPHGLRAAEIKLTSTSGWRFDGNPYEINAVCHPLFGTLTTYLARENGYSIAESFAISTLASGTWETFLELREYGSLNDMMMTSPAGLPLGETAYQLVHHWREARYDVGAGVGVENGAGFAETTAHVGVNHVALAADVATDAAGVRSIDVAAKTKLGDWVASEIDYHDVAARPEREWDKNTMVALGPTFEMRTRVAGLDVFAGADAYVDFAMLKSEAFSSWRTDHPMAVLRNVLMDRPQPYYYGAGMAIDPHIMVSTSGFTLGAKLTGSRTSSLDGHDRDQEKVDTQLHMTDTDMRGEAWLGYQVDDLSITLDGRVHRRTGTANEVEASTGERAAVLAVGYRI